MFHGPTSLDNSRQLLIILAVGTGGDCLDISFLSPFVRGDGGGDGGGGGGVMVLGKLPVPGHPTNLNNSRGRAY